MKKFLFGMAAGLVLLKLSRAKQIKAQFARVGDSVFNAFLDRLIERAMKNGVSTQEMEEFIRIVSKAMS